ncbi:MAG: hypothetical protein MMC33_004090 [Icmadophila ericetorum]|nr:hypothetical protein [Icmadophila ericetorum]
MSTAETPSEVSNLTEAFKTRADTYEKRTGSATRAVMKHLVSVLPPPPTDAVVLDNACGTGFVTDELLKAFPDSNLKIHAVDVSEGMINIMKALVEQKGWEKNVEAKVMNGQQLEFPENTFDLSITNFGIFFFPGPAAGVKEIYRTLKPKGTAVVTCWKVIGLVPIFYEVQKIVNPAKPIKLETLEKWMDKETLVQTMGQGGFRLVEIEEKDVTMVQDTWNNMVEGVKMFIESCVKNLWTPEEFAKIETASKEVLKEQSEKLCVVQDGKPCLNFTAWEAFAKKA